jgi:hypothetical protein
MDDASSTAATIGGNVLRILSLSLCCTNSSVVGVSLSLILSALMSRSSEG